MNEIYSSGFTLIEVIIVMAIIAILGIVGIIFGLDSYTRSVCHSERDTLVFLIYRARNKAVDNADKMSHGIHFENDKYILFSGDIYRPSDALNETTSRGSSVPISISTSSVVLSGDIIFNQLTGRIDNSNVSDIFIGSATTTCHDIVSLNKEGRLDW